MAELAIASIFIAMLVVVVVEIIGYIKWVRWNRHVDKERSKQPCIEHFDICTECGDCYLDHIQNHGRYSHTFTNQ